MKIHHKVNYQEARSKEYPPLEELADALYWQSRGDMTKIIAYFAKIDAVKARFKKPDDPLR